jgi:hypothetical protein
MADLKISQLTAITTLTPATDVLPVVDVTGTTKKITSNQILGAGGTATLASATISGDLTVNTNVLKVDSTNDRVGIGTASPSVPLEIYKASGDSKMRITSGSNTLTVGWDDPNGFYYTANTALMAWQLSTGTAMTLNSTGLGVGGSPTNKLTIGTGSFNADTVSGSASLYATVAAGMVILADGLAVATRGGVNNFIADTSGNLISRLTTTAPTLSDNGYMVFNLTSNTNLRITVKCNDGTTRTANITLAP